jgi:hypothetical protein
LERRIQVDRLHHRTPSKLGHDHPHIADGFGHLSKRGVQANCLLLGDERGAHLLSELLVKAGLSEFVYSLCHLIVLLNSWSMRAGAGKSIARAKP